MLWQFLQTLQRGNDTLKTLKIGEKALPQLTGVVMNKVPDFIPLWVLVLGGVYWLAHRKEEVAAAEAIEKQGGVA